MYNKLLRIIGLIGFITLMSITIYEFSSSGKRNRDLRQKEFFLNDSFNFIVDTIYENPNDHMNLTIFHSSNKKWVVSPFIKNLNEVKEKIHSKDSIVKLKENQFIVIYRGNSTDTLNFKFLKE